MTAIHSVSQVILIGCGAYEDPLLPDLRRSAHNLREMSELVLSPLHVDLLGDRCWILDDAKGSQVYAALEGPRFVPLRGATLVYFTGYVTVNESTPTLLVADSRVEMPKATGIEVAELFERLARFGPVVAILDLVEAPGTRPPLAASGLNLPQNHDAMFIASIGRVDPVGDGESETVVSPLTLAMIEAIREPESRFSPVAAQHAFETARRALSRSHPWIIHLYIQRHAGTDVWLVPGRSQGWPELRGGSGVEPVSAIVSARLSLPYSNGAGRSEYGSPWPSGSPDDTGAKRTRRAERHVNVEIADPLTQATVHDDVKPATSYLLRVDIGELRYTGVHAIGVEQFPDARLPVSEVGWWLDAVLSSADVTCDARPQPLFLGVTGPSFSCSCDPLQSHRCLPGERRAQVALPFTTHKAGKAVLLLVVYYGAAAVQAIHVTFDVGRARANATSNVVFSLSRDLSSLSRYAGRAVSIVSHDPVPGQHSLLINDASGTSTEFVLLEQQSATAARTLRQQLFDIHLEQGKDGRWRSRYGAGFEKADSQFVEDMHQLALVGRQAYVAIFPHTSTRTNLHRQLADVLTLGRIPTIQVARAQGTRIAVPWQALYELPIAADLSKAAICPSLNDIHRPDNDPYLTRCPYESTGGHGGDHGVLCPYGFWGLSYLLEIPPWTLETDLAEQTGTEAPASILTSVNQGVAGQAWERHHQTLTQICRPAEVKVARGTAALRAGAQHGSDLLYLLCHGIRRARGGSDTPVLEIEPGDQLTPQELADWAELNPRVYWQHRRPLVLLNGCHTGEVLPDTLSDFVTAFTASLGASGVVATEIALDRDLACHVMEQLIRHLWAGEGVGMALWRVRRQLLRHGNLMGLAYSPYCNVTLRLPV